MSKEELGVKQESCTEICAKKIKTCENTEAGKQQKLRRQQGGKWKDNQSSEAI